MSDFPTTPLTPTQLENLLRGILKLSTEAFIVIDAASRVRLYSPGAAAMFQYPEAEVVGGGLDRLIPDRFRVAHAVNVRCFDRSPLESQAMDQRSEVIGRRRNGEEFFAEATISKLDTPEGRFFFAILRDATERRAARQAMAEALAAAEAANEAKSAFLATMSHEIRTPLNGILGMVQAMNTERLSAAQLDQLSIIRQSGEALLAILNDVLDLAKIEAGRMELETIAFDLEAILMGAQSTFTAIANRKGLSFSFDLTNAAGRYLGDPTRIRQVLYNLISNALKFTEAGEVQVRAGYARGRLRLSVSDTGVGIAPEAVGRLFEPFAQADSSIVRRHGGTGLGLAICRQLAELMGGAVSVESWQGEGSTFALDIPLQRAAACARDAVPGRLAEDAAAAAVDLPPLQVLAAEDNPTNRLVLKTVLHQVGLHPAFAEDGRQALELWRTGEFDLILMDVQMPHLSGPEATRLIRQEEVATGRRRTVIVALTANAMAHQLAQYRAAGMDHVLTKPIEVPKLIAVLREVLVSLGPIEAATQ